MPRLGVIDCSVHQKRFLECFVASGGIINKASRWAQITRQAHYNWLREDPTYPKRFAEAEARAARCLQDEATRRAHDGVRKAIYYKGKIVGWEHEYSDSLMLALLKATQPEKFRDRTSAELTGPGGNELVVTVRSVLDKPKEG